MNRGDDQFPDSAFDLMRTQLRNSSVDDHSAIPEPPRAAPSYSPMSTVVRTKPSEDIYSDYHVQSKFIPPSNGVPDYDPGQYVPPSRSVPETVYPPQQSSAPIGVVREYEGERTVKKGSTTPGVLTVEEWERRVAEKEKNERLGHGAFTDAELAQRGINVTERVNENIVNQRVSQHVSQAIQKHDATKSPSTSTYTPDEHFAPPRSHAHQLSDQELQGLKDAAQPLQTRQPHVLSPAQTNGHGTTQPMSIVDRDPILQKVLERGRQQRSIESNMPVYGGEERHAGPQTASYASEGDAGFQPQTLSEIITKTRAPLPPPSNERKAPAPQQFHDSGAYSSIASSFDSMSIHSRQEDNYQQMWDHRGARQAYQPPSLGGDYTHDGRRRVVGSAPHMHGVPGTLGVGFRQSGTEGPIRVAGLQEGLPAAIDGRIRVGDVLYKINHNPIPLDLHSVVQKLQGDVGESVRLTMDRPDLSPAGMYDVTLVRMPFPDKPPPETALSRAQAAAQRAKEEKDKSNLCRVCMPIL